MKLKELRRAVKEVIFVSKQVNLLFRDEPRTQINTQLARMANRGDLVRLRRGIYAFSDQEVDDLVVASYMYQPSYISLETALNLYGIIPDVSSEISCVTTVTSRRFDNQWGRFSYSKIAKKLFFGFEKQLDEMSGLYYNLAIPEKALLDYIYIRQVRDLKEMRINIKLVDEKKLRKYIKLFPEWVGKVVISE